MFRVIYEDENIIAVDKPPGVAVIPERKPDGSDIITELRRVRGPSVYAVHRLDKPVSGVLLVAKNRLFHRYLNKLFEERKVHKHYIAVVHGRVDQKRGTISAPIRRFGSGRMGVDFNRGKRSVTHFKVLAYGRECTMMALFPTTGRPHQLRVHLYHIGHPVVGDKMYGERATALIHDRTYLHCMRLKLPKPQGQDFYSFKSSVPPEFRAILRYL
ncbi:RluA family pseudouridine synthase [Thermodesulforhabdus norvegica]|uniref:23S rRNA pseudouridine955/2504/2580 synthase n=1 Tax=Thermodesulforhabdus norvegica TaxID=39841 RepID=A0A1I4RFS2_9BACT|nr:RluA family pseudouridine synthase [Thermodesulforhabdus norvegica]SFM50896.1 23S rRNA pseudouridine955/2504/2580 synthase [Thermodesulforhabdus norvegica]